MLKNSAPKIRPKCKISHIAFFQKTDKIVHGGIGDSQGVFFRITNIRKERAKNFSKKFAQNLLRRHIASRDFYGQNRFVEFN